MLKTRDIVLLRTRTYEKCQEMDEKIFDTKDFEFGRTATPFHPNCRTTTIPVVEGIEDTAGRASRNPETGKTEIVENLTYKEWKDKYLLKEDKKTSNTFKEITKLFIQSKKAKGLKVKDLDSVTIDGEIYRTDNKKVVLDYSREERDVAQWLSDEIGGNIYMCPKVAIPKEIRTPDYVWDKEKWDLKNINTHGKNTINNAINNTKGQSNNVVLNLKTNTYTDEDILNEMDRIFSNSRYDYIDKKLVAENYRIRGVFKRK